MFTMKIDKEYAVIKKTIFNHFWGIADSKLVFQTFKFYIFLNKNTGHIKVATSLVGTARSPSTSSSPLHFYPPLSLSFSRVQNKTPEINRIQTLTPLHTKMSIASPTPPPPPPWSDYSQKKEEEEKRINNFPSAKLKWNFQLGEGDKMCLAVQYWHLALAIGLVTKLIS